MPGTTAKGLRYPAAGDNPAVHTDIQNLAEDVDTELDGYVGITTTQTLTNKTLTSPVISSITNGAATLTVPTTTGTLALTSEIPASAVNENHARVTVFMLGGL